MDDDVTVLNRPVETKYYSPPPDHVHTEVNLWLVPIEFISYVNVLGRICIIIIHAFITK